LICGQPGADTVDHITPISAGGTDDPANLSAAHKRCNLAKGARY
jgi:5-methylcytosine-specific restriction endonuclease McrA